MSQILERGHSIVGIDQAKGMLARAKEKFHLVQFEKIGLQEMPFENLFDGRSAWTPWSTSARKIGQGSCLIFGRR